MPHDSNAVEALYASLEEGSDKSTWLVLADALLEAGDVRGELIHLQYAEPQPGMARRIDAFIQEHARELLGFFPFRGLELDWRSGHVWEALVRASPPFESRLNALTGLLGPKAHRFLRALTLCGPEQDLSRDFFRKLFEQLIERDVAPASLTSLQLGEGLRENQAFWVYGFFNECRLYDHLGDLWRIFPQLRSLRLDLGASDLELGSIHAEQLRDFEWVSPFLAARHLAPLYKAHWPNLERLVVWTGAEVFVNEEQDLYDGELGDAGDGGYAQGYRSEDTLALGEVFEDLFAHLDTLQGLRSFGVANYEGQVTELVQRAAQHVFWRRLASLDLTRARLNEGEIGPLLEALRALPSLERVVVEGMRVSSEVANALREGLPGVEVVGETVEPTPSAFYYVVTAE